MVDYSLKDLFGKDNIDKQLIIEAEDGSVTITNIELHQESFELTESICSESELTFGACEAAVIKFTISNTFTSLKDKWLTVKMVLDGNTDNPFTFGRYKVYSDVPTADRTKRDITAYDALYDVINADVADWYNELLPDDDSTTTMKALRDSFFAHFGIAQEDIDLANDSMSVEKTVAVETLSGSQVLNAICEINGCMGHIGRDGKFKYLYLAQAGQSSGYPSAVLYPSPTLYPGEVGGASPEISADAILSKSIYIAAEYEDYEVSAITGVHIRQEENDAGGGAGTDENVYVIDNNFLAYGKTDDELTEIAQNILSKISRVIYRPYEVDAKGNPCIEVGDTIQIPTKYATINSFVLKRTLKGIQALRDDYSAEGEQFRTAIVNGTKAALKQLRERSNILTRTVEETRSTVRATMVTWDTSGYTKYPIANKGYGVPPTSTAADNSGNAYLDIETGYIYYSDGTAWIKDYECPRASSILESQIVQTAEQISSKVSKDNIISEINQTAEEVKIKASKISLEGEVFVGVSLDAPIITSDKTHAEAISIGKGDYYNNVVINEEGFWLIGDGSAEEPVIRMDNKGALKIQTDYYGGIEVDFLKTAKTIITGHSIILQSLSQTNKTSLEVNSYDGEKEVEGIKLQAGILDDYSILYDAIKIRGKEVLTGNAEGVIEMLCDNATFSSVTSTKYSCPFVKRDKKYTFKEVDDQNLYYWYYDSSSGTIQGAIPWDTIIKKLLA